MTFTIKSIVCDYAVICVDTGKVMCICSIKRNAELISDILNGDNERSCAYSYDVYPYAKYKIIKAESEDKIMNELDKLREMLTKAGIPYEDEIEPIDKITNELMTKHPEIAENYGEASKWRRNQVIYGRTGYNDWKWDGIWQFGSYGAADGMIESYGELGVDEEGYPNVVTAEEAFAVIKADYEGNKEEKE